MHDIEAGPPDGDGDGNGTRDRGATETALRRLLPLAGRAGAEDGRERESAARRVVVASIEHARALDAEYEEALARARARVRLVDVDAWWSSARAEEIAALWRTTSAWRQDDASVRAAHTRLAARLRQRYGIDADADADADVRREGPPDAPSRTAR